MSYYPKSRIITGLTANPGDFILPDGKEYLGPYYITFDGKSFAGENQFSKNSLNLTKSKQKEDNKGNLVELEVNLKYNKLNPNITIGKLQEPISSTPIISELDYKRGQITRYFAKERKVRNFKIIEISKEIYNDIFNREGIYNYSGWDVISMFWVISNGTLNLDFVKTQNIRIIDIKNKHMIGLKEYITNPTQFSK